MSIGAQRGDVLWLFLKESAFLVGAGIVAGLALALMLSKFIARMLFHVKTNDAAGIAITLGLMVVAAMGAALIPARRAAAIDPVRALRYD